MSGLIGITGSIVLAVFVLVAVPALWLAFLARPRRPHEPGAFEYVYVEDDGGARELTAEESEYLATDFPPGDGWRPYVKLRYESRTPDGRLGGYLPRRRLPRRVAVRPAPSSPRHTGRLA